MIYLETNFSLLNANKSHELEIHQESEPQAKVWFETGNVVKHTGMMSHFTIELKPQRLKPSLNLSLTVLENSANITILSNNDTIWSQVTSFQLYYFLQKLGSYRMNLAQTCFFLWVSVYTGFLFPFPLKKNQQFLTSFRVLHSQGILTQLP